MFQGKLRIFRVNEIDFQLKRVLYYVSIEFIFHIQFMHNGSDRNENGVY